MVVACGPLFFSEIIMIFTFVLAVSLALISFLAGGYIVKVALFTGVAKLAILITALWVVFWLFRRLVRGRGGRVLRIPRL